MYSIILEHSQIAVVIGEDQIISGMYDSIRSPGYKVIKVDSITLDKQGMLSIKEEETNLVYILLGSRADITTASFDL